MGGHTCGAATAFGIKREEESVRMLKCERLYASLLSAVAESRILTVDFTSQLGE